MNALLKYVDEADKCYGVAGMVVSLLVYDSENLIASVSVDADAVEALSFTPEAQFVGNPRFSPKMAWNQSLKQFQLISGMVIGNLMCRQYVQHHRRLTDNVERALQQFVAEQGNEICQLEKDETDNVYNKTFSYFDNVFSHSRVHSVVNDFVETLRQRRTMTALEVLDQFQALNML